MCRGNFVSQEKDNMYRGQSRRELVYASALCLCDKNKKADSLVKVCFPRSTAQNLRTKVKNILSLFSKCLIILAFVPYNFIIFYVAPQFRYDHNILRTVFCMNVIRNKIQRSLRYNAFQDHVIIRVPPFTKLECQPFESCIRMKTISYFI